MKKLKLYVFYFFTLLYNMVIGYVSPAFIVSIFTLFSSSPNGYGYSVPSSELMFYKFLGLVALTIYLSLIFPLYFLFKRIYLKKKIMLLHIVTFLIGLFIFIWHFVIN